jgi:hypothetical protein
MRSDNKSAILILYDHTHLMKFKPDKHLVSEKELLGRRIFGDKIWDGFHQPAEIFRWDHFYEERLILQGDPDDGLSFDRVGIRAIAKDVLAELRPVAEREGLRREPPRQFNGWAVVPAAKMRLLTECELCPAPINPENPYHAVLRIMCYGKRDRAREIASFLAHLASLPPHPGLVRV